MYLDQVWPGRTIYGHQLCRPCGLAKKNERCLLSGQVSDVRSVLSLVLEEQAKSLGIDLDVSGFLKDGNICRSCLCAHRTYKVKRHTAVFTFSRATVVNN